MRTEPSSSGPELQALPGFLDQQRETILRKTDGLTREQLAQPLPPSSLTLAGLVNHLSLTEDSWFRVRFLGLAADPIWAGRDWEADPDYEFRTAVELDPEQLRQRYRDACARSREVVAGAGSLDQLSVGTARDGNALGPSLGAPPHARGDRAACGARRPAARGGRRIGRRVRTQERRGGDFRLPHRRP